MFQDIGVSKDLNEQFRRHLNETLKSNEPLDIDFQIQVFINVILQILFLSKKPLTRNDPNNILLSISGFILGVVAVPTIMCVLITN